MERIGERLIWYYVPGTDTPIPMGGLNVLTVLNTLIVMVFLWAVLWLAVRRRALVPTRGQMLVETVVGAFDGLVASSLELETKKANRKFFPLICSLFLFLFLANFMGFPPFDLFEEPTADINCTLALGTMAVAIATACGIRAKGIGGYTAEMMGPLWSQPGIAGKLSALFFFPLNVIGELSKIVSISFRLFGNIIGGAIIIVVVSQLVYNFGLPLGLDFFFVFFVGAIQAFVFTMLTLTYIAVAIK
jgi:F-type H+-transporting ATPase subunit a